MRKIVYVGLAFLALVAIGWSAVWFYAAHEANAQLDAWLKSEGAQGRVWTCPDRGIGGYPFTLAISCTNPTFTGRAANETDHWTAARLVAEVALAHPQSLAVTLAAPLTYKNSAGRADVKVNWSSASIDVGGLTKPEAATIHTRDIVVDGDFGDGDHQHWNAGGLDIALDLKPEEPDLGFTIAVKGATVPVVDALIGSQAPVDADLAGRLGRADVGDAATLPEAIERWRQAGGRVALAQSRVSRDSASVSGSGNLGLDEAHRLQGHIDASFVGLESVLKRYGIGGNVAAAGSLLSALFGGGRPQAPTQPGAISLPINFQDGRLGVGPFRLQVALRPLY